MYRLKRNVPDITMVDGPFENKTFRAGEVYQEVPPAYGHYFEKIPEPAPVPPPDADEAIVKKGGKK